MKSILSIDQQHIIVDEFNYLYNCFFGLCFSTQIITTLKFLRNLNILSNDCIDYSFINYFKSSYFTDGKLKCLLYVEHQTKSSLIFFTLIASGGFITELFIPLLRYLHVLLLVWFTFK